MSFEKCYEVKPDEEVEADVGAEPRYEGIYEYYGPDFSIDGYKFRQGKLRYVSDIDLHSPRQKASDYIPEKIKQRRKKEVGTGI